MGITKPYYRIIRADISIGGYDWVSDVRYSNDRYELIHAYQMIENDLKKIFEYIQPSDNNFKVYSHRLYEILLRASTEFETNCKKILTANSYVNGDDWNINDYKKIESANRLSEYKVKLNIWNPHPLIIQPFENWGESLSWYKDYNFVKHNRNEKFFLANMENVLKAVSGLLCILFSQFYVGVFNSYNDQDNYTDDFNNYEFIYTDNSLFSINPYCNWTEDEKYIINWNELKNDSNPFQKFRFQ